MSPVVSGYLLLLTITLAFGWAVRRVHRRTVDPGVLVGAVILYVWTLAGAWFFIGDAATGFHGHRIGLAYYYLMEKMFPFELDGDYVKALALYGVFLLAVLLALDGSTRKLDRTTRPAPVRIDLRALLVLGALAMVASAVLVWPQLNDAVATGRSFYQVLRATPGRWGTLHNVANGIASFCLLFGQVVVIASNAGSGPFRGRVSWTRWGFPIMVGLLCLYLSVIGDRHSLLTMAIAAVLFLWSVLGAGALRRGLPLWITLGVALLVGGQLRGFTVNELRTLKKEEVKDEGPFRLPAIAHVPRHPEGTLRRVGGAVLNNELFAAHFSLYGILRMNVRPEPFVSFRYLASSAVPAALGAPRPKNAYDVYAEGARLTPGQGYTIHHAAAWYLNFGLIGPLLGGLLLGLVWGWTLRVAQGGRKGRGALVMLPFLFVAFLPQVLRNGPEAYRTLLLEGFLIPMVLVGAAILFARWRNTEAT